MSNNELKFLLTEDSNPNFDSDQDFIRLSLEDLRSSLTENLLSQFMLNKNFLKIVLVGSESHLNKYLQIVYLNLMKLNQDYSKLFQHYIIPDCTNSPLFSYLLNLSPKFNCDMNLDQYVNTGCQSLTASIQVGEVMLNFENEIQNETTKSKFIPFLSDVKIGFVNTSDDVGAETGPSGKMSLSTSSSLPQFLNHQNNREISNIQNCVINNTKRFSPPHSPQASLPGVMMRLGVFITYNSIIGQTK